MTTSEPARRRWHQFTLGNVLVLTLGVALGFAPLRLWELSARPRSHIAIKLLMVETAPNELPDLGAAGSSLADGPDAQKLYEQIEALARSGLAKVVSEPMLITADGQPATFSIGGQIAVPHVTSEGLETLQFKDYGTEVTLHPTLARNGRIELAIEMTITQLDSPKSDHSEASPSGGPPLKFASRTLSSSQELASGDTVVLNRLQNATTTGNSPRNLIVIASVEALPQR